MRIRNLARNLRYLTHKLASLRIEEWRDLFAAQMALISAQVSVWLRRRGKLVSADSVREATIDDGPIDASVIALGRAVNRAASFGFVRAQCLVRSIALARLMESRGFEGAIVRVGVSHESQIMLAHAWVEYNGAVIGDDEEHISRFEQLPGIDLDI